MEQAAKKMLDWMKRHGFQPKPGERHLLAVSGGLDSICMAFLYKSAGLDFGIAHCNFQLREEASDMDADFVEKFAKSLDVPYYSTVFNTKEAAGPTVSIQMAARNLRYAYFEKIIRIFAYSHVATAHHKDDAIETALFNFQRGTGIKGMRGIPIKNNKTIRPMLCFSRLELETLAEKENIVWREDSSNKTDSYARNFIRHNIISKFKTLNPNFSETATKSLMFLKDTSQNHDAFLHYFLDKELKKDDRGRQILTFLSLDRLPAPQELLYDWLHSYGFTEEHVRQLLDSKLNGQPGFTIRSGEYVIWRQRIAFILDNPKRVEVDHTVERDDLMTRFGDGKQVFVTVPDEDNPYPDGRFEIVADEDKIYFPVRIRNWKKGDSFTPFGMRGHSQKIQDFLINNKVELSEKEHILVMEDADGEVCWIIGYRMSETWRVDANTKKRVKFTVQ